MRPSSRLTSFIALAAGMALFAAACSAAATPTPAATVAGATATAIASSAGSPAAVDTSSAAAGLTLGSTPDSSMGDYLTGPTGMTLYVFTKDTPDVSTCSGACATTWPPLTTTAGATITGPTGATGAFATITRSDGTIQVTYNHMPLYYYSGDSAAGDTTGQGLNNVWFVAPLSGSLASPASSASAGY
jgi:predicted lipoprotein with Yx(FWY)xxD motif